jgi:peptide/nickel transport system ATP-binding protein
MTDIVSRRNVTAPATGDAPLLRVQDLRVDYLSGGRFAPAVRGVSFDVNRGEVVALVGESGSGKTTVAHSVIGLLPPEGVVTNGSVQLRGRDITRLRERQLRGIRGAQISLIPQDPTVSLNPVKRIGDQIAEGIRIHEKVGRRTALAQSLELLDAVAIDRPALRAQQYPHELSGGMRQRVLIAIALACNPALIVADEPTSALDVTVQRTVLDSLQALTSERGTSVLLVTHDLGVAVDRADRIVVMNKGKVVEEGPAVDIVRRPSHSYTRQLISDAPSLTALRAVAATGSGGDGAATPATGQDGAALITLAGLTKRFHVIVPNVGRTDILAVDGVDLSITRGTTTALVGESGSGKSTIARIIAGLEAPTSGTVILDGADLGQLTGAARRRARSRIKFVYQNPYASLDPRFTVGDIIEEPLRVASGSGRGDRQRRVREILDHVALPESYLARRPAELSGGQRQRVAIARALVLRPELVVLDEPVSALDVTVQAQILRLLASLQAEFGLTYLLISHDLAVVRLVADSVGVMREGRIVERGTSEQLFSAPQDDYTRRLLDAIPGGRALERAEPAS